MEKAGLLVVHGGNCWNSIMSTSEADVPVTDFPELDELIESHCSSIPFLVYKRLVRTLVKTEESYEGCYYGGSGSTTYNKYIEVEELYNFLKEEDLLE